MRFEDKYDAQSNNILWALTENQRVVGSIRTTWFDPASSLSIPELDAYSSDIASQTPPSVRLFSGSRFVTDPDRPDRDSQWAMLLLRHHVFTFQYLQCDWALAAVRANHIPFYRRILRLKAISQGKIYPGLTCLMQLMACDFKQNISAVYLRTPILRPIGHEKVFMDKDCKDDWETGCPIVL
jgi:hypothetical protein